MGRKKLHRSLLWPKRRRRLRARLWAERGGRCCYCGDPVEPDAVTLDHVIPLAAGGTHADENLVMACKACNDRKADSVGGPGLMLENVPTRRVRFAYREDALEVEIRPADIERNPLYRAAAIAYIQPLELSARLPEDHPRRLSERRALEVLAKAYGMAILAGSPTDDALQAYGPAEWTAWLLAHPDEFADIRAIAETRATFEPATPPPET